MDCKILDEQGTGRSFLAIIKAREMAGNIEKQELEQSSVEAHREQRRRHFQMGDG